MEIFFGRKKTLYTLIFFLFFLLVGVFIFEDYGISIDEDNTRIVGFLSLENILKFFSSEHLIRINEIIFERKQEHPNLDTVPTSGVVFDLPMAFLELIFEVEDSRNYYLLRHFFNFNACIYIFILALLMGKSNKKFNLLFQVFERPYS